MPGHLTSRFTLLTAFSVQVALFAFTALASAQTPELVAKSAQIRAQVDSSQTTKLRGHVPFYAETARLPSSEISPTADFARLTLVLNRGEKVEAAFEQLLADQQDPSSPKYHQWLQPAQVGELYGPALSDVEAVTDWLRSKGLSVVEVSPSRTLITFGGSAFAVASAFSTSFRVFNLGNGETRYSLAEEPSIPVALAPAIKTIAGLSQVIHHPTAKRGVLVSPEAGGSSAPGYTSSKGNHYLVAGDFAIAYDMNPVYAAGYDGTGQKIAVVGESRVDASDVTNLQSLQGQTTKLPNVIIPPTGVDPGTPGDTSGKDNGYQDEATLDVDRTLGNAPGAQVDLVVSGDVNGGSTYATDGLYIAINYAINTLNDPILSISFGGCEALNGAANTNYESSIFQTAAAQGISVFISAGDDGAAACNAFSTTNTSYANILSINDLCSGPYVTCLGGTEFADSTNANAYWSASSGANGVSLLSYIPEGAWNDISLSSSGTYSEGGTGGGVSTVISKPSWQVGTGVPAGSFRWIPDIALTSSPHDGFVTCLNYLGANCTSTGFYSFGGTSAAAPSMAAIQAVTNQRLGGSRQGNLNPLLYALGGSFSNAFHDVTAASSGVSSCVATTPSLCNNSLPGTTTLAGGLPGYLVTKGWDATTGWGSLDVANYVKAVSTTGFTISPAAITLPLAASSGTTVTDTITLSSVDAFSGTVALTCAVTTASGTAAGNCSLSSPSVSVAAGGTATSVLTVSNTGMTAGTLSVVISGLSGAVGATSPAITVNVGTGGFTVTPTTNSLTFTSGATTGNSSSVTLASVGGFAGQVSLTCSISSSTAFYQPTCSVTPASVALTSGGTASATVTVASTTAVTVTSSLRGAQAPFFLRMILGGSAFAVAMFFGFARRRERSLPQLFLLGLLTLSLGSLAGCGGGGNAPVAQPPTQPITTTTTHSSDGTYLVTVTGTSGTVSASTSFVAVIK